MTEAEQLAIAEWLRLVNGREFFAAHEVLEGPWLRAEESSRALLKGLIHVAVALHHYSRGNAHGARVKSRSALQYLERYPAGYGGLDLADLRAQLQGFFAELLDGEDEIPAQPEAWPIFGPSPGAVRDSGSD